MYGVGIVLVMGNAECGLVVTLSFFAGRLVDLWIGAAVGRGRGGGRGVDSV